MIYVSWSRRRRTNRRESLESPVRKKKAGLEQAWVMENARLVIRMTRRKMASRSDWWDPEELELEGAVGAGEVQLRSAGGSSGKGRGGETSPVTGSTCRQKMTALMMTKPRNLRVMGTRKRRKKTLKRKLKR